MSDVYGYPRLDKRVEPGRSQEELDRFWDSEIERRRSRTRSWAATAVGGSGTLGSLVLFAETTVVPILYGGGPSFFLASVVATAAAGTSSLWLTARGLTGLWNSRLPALPARRAERGSTRRGGGPEKETERQVLEVLQRHGEVTPARVALETALTADEAQRKLSELAEKGHVDVRVEGSKLVYSL